MLNKRSVRRRAGGLRGPRPPALRCPGTRPARRRALRARDRSSGPRQARAVAGPQVRPADALGPVQPVGRRRIVVDLRRGRGLVPAEPVGLHRVQAALRGAEDDVQPGEVRSGAVGESRARGRHEVRGVHHQAPRRLLDVRHEVHRLQGDISSSPRSAPTRGPTSRRRSSTRSARTGSGSARTSRSRTGTTRTTGGRTSPRPIATSTTTPRSTRSAGRRSPTSPTTR